MKEEGSCWWEEPSSQTEVKEKADDISAEVDNFKEALENHVEVCDVHNPQLHPPILPWNVSIICHQPQLDVTLKVILN